METARSHGLMRPPVSSRRPQRASAIVATDFDNRRDIDLLIAGTGGWFC
jgi:hypothetical protein